MNVCFETTNEEVIQKQLVQILLAEFDFTQREANINGINSDQLLRSIDNGNKISLAMILRNNFGLDKLTKNTRKLTAEKLSLRLD